MLALLLAMTLGAQSPAVPQNSSIVGLLKTAAGTPASRVSVAAAAVPGDRTKFDRTAVVSLVQTDEQGRYLLENIPPGRYYIVAGRLDFPTFYPGGIRSEAATVLEISSGVQVLGIDFTVDEDSVRPGTPFTLKVQVLVEGGGRLPDTAARPIIQLTRTAITKSLEVPITTASFTLPDAGATYQIRLLNLPNNYVLTSMTLSEIDLTKTPLTIPPPPLRVITFTGQGALQEAIDRASQRLDEARRTLSITLSRRDPTDTPEKETR